LSARTGSLNAWSVPQRPWSIQFADHIWLQSIQSSAPRSSVTSSTVDGDPAILASLVGVVAPVDPDFAVVTP